MRSTVRPARTSNASTRPSRDTNPRPRAPDSALVDAARPAISPSDQPEIPADLELALQQQFHRSIAIEPRMRRFVRALVDLGLPVHIRLSA